MLPFGVLSAFCRSAPLLAACRALADASVGGAYDRSCACELCSSPVITTIEGKRQLVTLTREAMYGVDPATGEFVREVPIPSPQVTSVAFGGADMEDLCVSLPRAHTLLSVL